MKKVFVLSCMDCVRKNSFNTEKIGKNMHNGLKKLCMWKKIFLYGRQLLHQAVQAFGLRQYCGRSISLLEEFQHKGYAYCAMKKIITEHSYHYLVRIKK